MKLDFANVFIVSCVIGGLYFFYYVNEQKENNIVKKLASSYKYASPTEIDLLSSILNDFILPLTISSAVAFLILFLKHIFYKHSV